MKIRKIMHILMTAAVGTAVSCAVQNQPPPLHEQIKNLRSDLQKSSESLQGSLEEEKKARIDLEKKVDDLDKFTRRTFADRSVTMDELRVEIQRLKGIVEETSYKLEKLSEKHDREVEVILQRLAEIEKKMEDIPTSTKTKYAAIDKKDKNLSPTKMYNKGRQLMEKKKFNKAAALFSLFLKKYPKHKLAPNAAYWRAECFYAQRDFPHAIIEFQKVLDKYPKSAKRCHSLLKQGLAFEELGKKKEATAFFKEVKAVCPKTPQAKRAQKELKKIEGKKKSTKRSKKPDTKKKK